MLRTYSYGGCSSVLDLCHPYSQIGTHLPTMHLSIADKAPVRWTPATLLTIWLCEFCSGRCPKWESKKCGCEFYWGRETGKEKVVCGSSYFRQWPGGRVCGSSYFRKLPGGGEAVVFAAAVAVVAVQVAPKRAAQPRPLAS